jgi:hypothetical protein
MATALAKANPAALYAITEALETCPVDSLKGSAYLLHLLARDDEKPTEQHRQALLMLAEHVEMMTVFLELDEERRNLAERSRRAGK